MVMKLLTPLTRTELNVVVIVTLLLFVGLLGTDIHLSALPQMVLAMNTSQRLMQLSISIFLIGVGLSALVYGPFSDKYGRKPIVLTGLVIAILGNLLGAFFSEAEAFLVARFVQGVGSGVCLVLSRIVLSDIVRGDRYAITSSYITLFTGLSIVLGPVIGSFIQALFGWRANFIVLAILLAGMLLLYAFRCPETNAHRNKDISMRGVFLNYKFVLCNATFLSATALAGIGMACFVMYMSISPFVMQQNFGVSPIVYGWSTAVVSVALLISRSLLPWLIFKYGMMSVMRLGLLILLFCGSLLYILSASDSLSVFSFLASISCVFFSYTFIVLCASAISMTPFSDMRGAAGAVYSFSQMALAVVVNLVAFSFSESEVLFLGVAFILLAVMGLYICRTMHVE